MYTVEHWGRRPSQYVPYFLVGVCLIGLELCKEVEVLAVVFAMVSRACILAASCITWVHVGEVRSGSMIVTWLLLALNLFNCAVIE